MEFKVGRRTGKDVLAGKTIRRNSRGIDYFEDYFTDDEDSDMSIVKPNNDSRTAPKENGRIASLCKSPRKSNDGLMSVSLRNKSVTQASSDESDHDKKITRSSPTKSKQPTPKRKSLANVGKGNALDLDTDDEDLFVPVKLDMTLLSKRKSSPVASTSRAGQKDSSPRLSPPKKATPYRLRLSLDSDTSMSDSEIAPMPYSQSTNLVSRSKASISNGTIRKGRGKIHQPSSDTDKSEEDPVPPNKLRNTPTKTNVPKPKAVVTNGAAKNAKTFESDEDYLPDEDESDAESIPPPNTSKNNLPVPRSSPSSAKASATNGSPKKSKTSTKEPETSESDEELARPNMRIALSPAKKKEREKSSLKGTPQRSKDRVESQKRDDVKLMLEELTWSDSDQGSISPTKSPARGKSQKETARSPKSAHASPGPSGSPQKNISFAKPALADDEEYMPSQSSESESHDGDIAIKKSSRLMLKILPKRNTTNLEKTYTEASSSGSEEEGKVPKPRSSKSKQIDKLSKNKAAILVLPKKTWKSVNGLSKLPKRKEANLEKTYKEASSSESETETATNHTAIRHGLSTDPGTSNIKQTGQGSKSKARTLGRPEKSGKSVTGPSELQSKLANQTAVVQLEQLKNVPSNGSVAGSGRQAKPKETAVDYNSDSSQSTVVMPVKSQNVRASKRKKKPSAKESPKYGLRSSPLKAGTMQKLLQNKASGMRQLDTESESEIITFSPRKPNEPLPDSAVKKFLVFEERETGVATVQSSPPKEPVAKRKEIQQNNNKSVVFGFHKDTATVKNTGNQAAERADERRKYNLRETPKHETQRRRSPRKKDVKPGGQSEDDDELDQDLPDAKKRTKTKQKPAQSLNQLAEESDEEMDPAPVKRTNHECPSTSGAISKRSGSKKHGARRENKAEGRPRNTKVRPDSSPSSGTSEGEEDVLKKSKSKAKQAAKRQMSPVVDSDEEMAPSPAKRSNRNASLVSKDAPRRGHKKKISSELVDEGRRNLSRHEEGNLRRSTRTRVPTLQGWKGQRIKYKRTSIGFTVSEIVEGSKYGTTTIRNRTKKKAAGSAYRSNNGEMEEMGDILVINPETGQECYVDCVRVKESYVYTNIEGATTKKTDPFVVTKPLQQKAFASGVIKIRPFMEKGMHYVPDDTMIFWVHKGTVEVTIHETVFVLKELDTFFVPQGNMYNIRNISNHNAVLTFVLNKHRKESDSSL